jgi:hypothetical protein
VVDTLENDKKYHQVETLPNEGINNGTIHREVPTMALDNSRHASPSEGGSIPRRDLLEMLGM